MSEELDKFIHENLFGKCWHATYFDEKSQYHRCRKCRQTGLILITDKINRNYSTDIADAFKVVNAMEAKGFVWTIANNGNEYSAKYDARFFLNVKQRGVPDVRAIAIEETLPLAICLAAKSALEGESNAKN